MPKIEPKILIPKKSFEKSEKFFQKQKFFSVQKSKAKPTFIHITEKIMFKIFFLYLCAICRDDAILISMTDKPPFSIKAIHLFVNIPIEISLLFE